MKITNVSIPKDVSNNGLEDIKMDKIDRIVLIAGKNGSGKSRIINIVKALLGTKPNLLGLTQAKKNIIQNEEQIKIYQNSLIDIEKNIKIQSNSPQIKSWEIQIENNKKTILNLQSSIEKSNQSISWNYILTDSQADNYSSIDFVPTILELSDWKEMKGSEVESWGKSVYNIGINSLSKGTLSYIKLIQDKWFNATHQFSNISTIEKSDSILKYDKLQDLLNIFLNVKLERDLNGYPTIFNFELGKANLSSGQKVLLQLCVAIHAQNATLNDLIIFMDEPENHLHPSAVIEIIKKIEENVPNGQLWIATHSIPLLSHFDPKYLWFMENNSISYAGRKPENVLNSLLGDEEQKAKLHNFMSLPSIYALNRFAHECLFDPLVLMTDPSDPQIRQIRDMLQKLSDKVPLIKILDFGAGKGRLLANVIEALGEDKSRFIEKYEYVAFDEYVQDKVDCQSYINSIYGNSDKKYYNSINQLFNEHDRGSFHVVVMCNVLHEIPVEEWKKYFGKNGSISECLNDNGFLLLVKDNEMFVGEKAHQKGFLVIDTSEIKDLFCIDSAKDTEFVFNDYRNDGKLKAHLIPKLCLSRMTPDTLKTAVKNLTIKAGENILQIRNGDKTFKNGMKHGFWVQIYANAQLFLN